MPEDPDQALAAAWLLSCKPRSGGHRFDRPDKKGKTDEQRLEPQGDNQNRTIA